MSEIPEKQIKRLRTLIQDAETNLAAAKELLIRMTEDMYRETGNFDVRTYFRFQE